MVSLGVSGVLSSMTGRVNRADDRIGPLERRVMEALWLQGTSTARDVVNTLNRDAERPLAYTTITTILSRLHDKGYVTRDTRRRPFIYGAAVDREELTDAAGRRELDRLIARYGASAVARFAADLSREHPELLRRLRELAENGH